MLIALGIGLFLVALCLGFYIACRISADPFKPHACWACNCERTYVFNRHMRRAQESQMRRKPYAR